MITPEQIPEDAWVELALRLESCGHDVSDKVARLAIVAALKAWPGMTIGCNEVISPHGEYGPRIGIDHHIRLPIMEPRDEV